MGLIGIALIVLLVISAILLILLVLVQDDQGEGIGGIFGGGSSTPFGSRTGNVLTKFTAVLAAVFLFCAFGLAFVNKSTEAGSLLSKARQEALTSSKNDWWVQTPAAPATQAPEAAPAAPAGTTAPQATTTPGGK